MICVHMYVCICTHLCVCVLDPFTEFRGGVRVRVRVRVRVTGVAVGSLHPSNPPGIPASKKKKTGVEVKVKHVDSLERIRRNPGGPP